VSPEHRVTHSSIDWQAELASHVPKSVEHGPLSAQLLQSAHAAVVPQVVALPVLVVPPAPPTPVLPVAPVPPVDGVPQQSLSVAAVMNRIFHRMRAT